MEVLCGSCLAAVQSKTMETKRIPLDRRVLVVREHRIDLRPERAAVIFPLIGLLDQPDAVRDRDAVLAGPFGDGARG